MKDCGLNDECMLRFCNVIQNNGNIKSFKNIRVLDLSWNNISDTYMSQFLNIIHNKMECLNELSLENTKISDNTCTLIHSYLNKNIIICKKINLQFNDNITDKGKEILNKIDNNICNIIV